MGRLLYIVCHCEAKGQSPHAKLTAKGERQAKKLVKFFDEIEVDQIISSPLMRARQTAWSIAESKRLRVEQDSRLAERVLSSRNFEDWFVKLEDSFLDVHMKYEGGESSIEAMTRIQNVVERLREDSRTVLVTHGNLMALLLKCYDEHFGFEEWQKLTHPDVFLLWEVAGDMHIKRIWKDATVLA